MRWQEYAGYRIPRVNRVRGKKGKALIQFVKNLPDPDTEGLQEKVDRYIQNALEARKNGATKKLVKKHK